MSAKEPTARLQHRSDNRSVWEIKFPSTPRKLGKTYIAITYPGSELVSMETAAKRRPVSANVGRKLLPIIKQAIQKAQHVN